MLKRGILQNVVSGKGLCKALQKYLSAFLLIDFHAPNSMDMTAFWFVLEQVLVVSLIYNVITLLLARTETINSYLSWKVGFDKNYIKLVFVVVVVSIIAAIAVVDIDSVDSRFCEALNITFWVSKHLKCRLMRPTTEFKIHWDTQWPFNQILPN